VRPDATGSTGYGRSPRARARAGETPIMGEPGRIRSQPLAVAVIDDACWRTFAPKKNRYGIPEPSNDEFGVVHWCFN
jgi:hypothetical protein